MLQLTRSGTRWSGQPGDLQRLRSEFDGQPCVRLPRLLDSDILDLLNAAMAQAEFYERTHPNIGVEQCMKANVALALLHFITNEPRFFHLVRQVTQCDRISSFLGRVYRMAPGAGHYDKWHRDNVADRLIGMSINLGPDPYEGGVFRMRKVGSSNVLCEAPNTGCGDAILFRIADDLEHMVTPLEGTVAKTAFAGWFVSEPDFFSLLTP